MKRVLLFFTLKFFILMTFVFSTPSIDARSRSRRSRGAPEPNIPSSQQIPYCKSELEKRLQKLYIKDQPRFSSIEMDEKPIHIEESEFARFARKKSKTVYGHTMTLNARGVETKGIRNIKVKCGYAQNHLMSLTFELQDLLSLDGKKIIPMAKESPFAPVNPLDKKASAHELEDQEATMEKELPQDSTAPTFEEEEEDKVDPDAIQKAVQP